MTWPWTSALRVQWHFGVMVQAFCFRFNIALVLQPIQQHYGYASHPQFLSA